MKFYLNLDNERLQAKPAIFDGRLRNRLCRPESVTEITPEDLKKAIREGRSFTPALMTGTSGDKWISQQIICADIDNDTGTKDADGHKLRLSEPLTPERALEVMAQYGIAPAFMYYSFSNSEQWPKFRIVLILSAPITNKEQAKGFISRFTGIFNQAVDHSADTTASDSARIYYGGKPDCIFYESDTITDITLLDKLPELSRAAEHTTERAGTPAESTGTRPEYKSPAKREQREYRPLNDLQAMFNADKANFNLAEYVEQTTESRPIKRGNATFYNPCPICGHNDDFQISGPLYHCFSASGGSGGTIIDYLMNKYDLDKSAAMDFFKFDIMRYDRDEWRAAFIADGHPATTGAPAPATPAEQPPEAPELEDQSDPRPDNTKQYIDTVMTADIANFKSDIKTGFPELDAMTGGLYSGLYVLAAISSLGKTSFALQLADQIAAAGNDVLFFSLEQSRLELVTKSLARITAQSDPETAVNSLSIRKGYLPAQVIKAAETYKNSVSERISIIEGNFNCNISFIGDYIRRYVKRNNVRPVVFIDYLQILQPAETISKQTTKDNVDTAVTELKRLTRELNITLFAISSVNRSNYLTPIDFESLKESGGIEFTADVILGLQLQCLNDELFDKTNNIKARREKIKEEKARNPRKIELVCLKNRYGIANFSGYFNYFPANDLFTESGFEDQLAGPGRKWENVPVV